jgi:hypothetical protein
VSSRATGTREGYGFDNLDDSAALDMYFVGPYHFAEVLAWYQRELHRLGWPMGPRVDAASGARWHRWERGLESIDLIDRVIRPDDPVARLPAGWRAHRLPTELPASWSKWSVTYKRRPPDEEASGRGSRRLRAPGDG